MPQVTSESDLLYIYNTLDEAEPWRVALKPSGGIIYKLRLELDPADGCGFQASGCDHEAFLRALSARPYAQFVEIAREIVNVLTLANEPQIERPAPSVAETDQAFAELLEIL